LLIPVQRNCRRSQPLVDGNRSRRYRFRVNTTSPKRYYEDFAVGDVLVLPERTLGRAGMIAFAAEFDPQPFHLDERAGGSGLSAGLSASGWYVCAVFMRMMCDGFLLETACHGSPGIERLEWRRPVRAGEILGGRSTVLDMRLSRSRPAMGLVRFRHEAMDRTGETVMWMENPVFIGRRNAQ
jgi:acyl dehydratase